MVDETAHHLIRITSGTADDAEESIVLRHRGRVGLGSVARHDVVMGKAVAGFFSFTEVTDPRQHRSYNEWHQLDHLPEQYLSPGVVHGQRWVSTPACRAARAVDGALLGPAHYLTLYVMADPLDQTLEDFYGLARRLTEANRFFEHRRSHLSGCFDLVGIRAGRATDVSDEAVLYRPNRGAYVSVESFAPGPAAAGVSDRIDRIDRLLDVSGVAGVATFVASGSRDRPGWPGEYRITVCYLDEDPVSVAPALDAVLGGDPVAATTSDVAFAGPFEAIIPWQWDWFDS